MNYIYMYICIYYGIYFYKFSSQAILGGSVRIPGLNGDLDLKVG